MRPSTPSRIKRPSTGPEGRIARWRGLPLRVAFVIGLAELGFATIIPLLPLYLTERLGASVKMVGMVVAAFALVETVMKTAWGSLADRVGRRPMIIGGLLLSSLTPFAMSLLRTPWLFVPLRLLDGGGSSALWPAAAAVIADTTPPHQRAAAMGTLNMFFLSGLALGPSLGLYAVALSGTYAAGFYLAGVVLFAAALISGVALRGLGATHLMAPPRPPARTEEIGYHGAAPNPRLEEVVESARRYPLFLSMLVVAFLQMFGAGLLAPILVIYARRVVGLSEHVIGTLFLLLLLSVAAASVPSGRLADRWGKLRSMAWGMALASLGMWILPVSPVLSVLVAAAFVLGVGYALAAPAWHAMVSEIAPPGRTAFALGTFQTAQGLGLVLGPLLGGLLWDEMGSSAPFVGAAVLLSLGTILLLVAARRAGSTAPAGPR
ncbi:MAG: MFS transporter [Armatimonadota bacterium]|nr:MFS transporter [Armatimonadota bacterium]MDR7465718.1 MFS transporter [Armatimonadota bacterium]MDR7493626.1 MFS transporter [Armatimonadota bacterium]MDR7499125.1 MFS transporter [Armatimonadota bacterium]MDR7503430.1 MFS transporter [Armatimonadota bacterium]